MAEAQVISIETGRKHEPPTCPTCKGTGQMVWFDGKLGPCYVCQAKRMEAR